MAKIKKIKHYCYCITNLINNKVYIGVTYKNINERFKEHVKSSKSKNKQAIHNAIHKYGISEFKITLISEYDNAELAYQAEIYYIKKYKSQNNKFGYNQSPGGDSGPILIRYKRKTILSIIRDYCNGISLKDIADKYNVSYCCVFDITRLRISRLHNIPNTLLNQLEKTKLKSSKRKRITRQQIINIIENYISGKTLTAISIENNIGVSNVYSILQRDTWKNIDIGIELEEKLRILNEKRR